MNTPLDADLAQPPKPINYRKKVIYYLLVMLILGVIYAFFSTAPVVDGYTFGRYIGAIVGNVFWAYCFALIWQGIKKLWYLIRKKQVENTIPFYYRLSKSAFYWWIAFMIIHFLNAFLRFAIAQGNAAG